MMKALLILLVACSAYGQQPYDLLLKNGHVIDPRNKVDGVMDVAIEGGKIAAVAPDIPASDAAKVIDVTGLYVTPGIIDLHMHAYATTEPRETEENSVLPDGFTFRSGVTTLVDAGSSGWRTFPDFKTRIIDQSQTRILALLNIVANGMHLGGGKQAIEDMDVKKTVARAKEFPSIVVGFKTAHYQGPEWTPVERAIEAGTLANLPVMIDFGVFVPERPFEELVLKRMRPGDVYTHFYMGRVPLLDDKGKLFPYLAKARARGVLFDVGHGAGSFLFRLAIPALQQNFPPDTISTDLHAKSMNGALKDMANLLSKFLNMGMPLDEVILRSTWNAAKVVKHPELGNLGIGVPADVAVFRLDKGNFGFTDVYGAKLKGTQKLECELTVHNGKIVWDLNSRAWESWDTLGNYLPQGGGSKWEGTMDPWIYTSHKK